MYQFWVKNVWVLFPWFGNLDFCDFLGEVKCFYGKVDLASIQLFSLSSEDWVYVIGMHVINYYLILAFVGIQNTDIQFTACWLIIILIYGGLLLLRLSKLDNYLTAGHGHSVWSYFAAVKFCLIYFMAVPYFHFTEFIFLNIIFKLYYFFNYILINYTYVLCI